MIPLLIGILYRSLFYGIKSVLGVELGIRFLSAGLQVAAFHYGGLQADLLLLILGFLIRVLVYGPSFYAIELIAFLASIVWRLMIYFSAHIYQWFYPEEKEDKARALVVRGEAVSRALQTYQPTFSEMLPVALTSF